MSERVMFEVIVSLDPMPGTFHTTESAAECLQAVLLSSIGHYSPVVMPARPQGDPADDPCVDGCGQDAATIERLRAERDRLHRLVTEAALETYTPDGSERFVAEFHRVLAERDRLAREIGDLCGQLGATEGSPVTDRIAARLGKMLRSPQNHPRSAADAPEAPGQPGRGEDAAQGDSCPAREGYAHAGHTWRFYSDDPYVICMDCNQVQDAITGRVIRQVRPDARP